MENRATPEVNSTQEVVYRPYNPGQEMNFNQQRNQGQNRDVNFQGNTQGFRNDQSYRDLPRNDQRYNQQPHDQRGPVHPRQNINPARQPVNQPVMTQNPNQSTNPRPNYNAVSFNYNDNSGQNNDGNKRRLGPKRANYPPLPQPWITVFWSLIEQNAI